MRTRASSSLFLLLLATCARNPAGPSAVGELEIFTQTNGGFPDPDGYTISVTGRGKQILGPNGALKLRDLPAGTYELLLTGLAANCEVKSPNPLAVTVTSSGPARAIFLVECAAPPGTVECPAPPAGLVICVNTDWLYLPIPEGVYWEVRLDEEPALLIPYNGSVTISPIAPGQHTVTLEGEGLEYCFVGNSSSDDFFNGTVATITVPASGNASITFSVLCAP